VQPEIPDLLRKRANQAEDRRGTEMSKVAGQSLPNALIKVVDLLVENRIRIDAMEQILVKTNPVAYEFYLSTIENLQAQKTAEVKKILTGRLKSKLSEG
jgi:prephenate dehydratase